MSATTRNADFAMRPMCEEDLPAVMRVEKAAYPHPWTEGIFRDCLRVGYSCWVLREAKEIVGYGVMSVAAGECQILNLCVHPQARRQGLGRKILRRLLTIGRSRNADTAFLEVPRLQSHGPESVCRGGLLRSGGAAGVLPARAGSRGCRYHGAFVTIQVPYSYKKQRLTILRV